MKQLVNRTFTVDELKPILDHADDICKSFDSNSQCRQYLTSKLVSNKTSVSYLVDNDAPIGICIIEILDKYYGNLILHAINPDDEPLFASLISNSGMLQKQVLELIQFRSNFNYRDIFLDLGYREKERMRMIHTNIKQFDQFSWDPHLSFRPITMDDANICGHISHDAHKHRLHIEHYDVYESVDKRAGFCRSLHSNKHGSIISDASLLMMLDDTPIGLVETTESKSWNMTFGWLMDVAIHPEHQGLGYGKIIVQKILQNLHQLGYQNAGLGVTLTNKNAKLLYEDLGFVDHEYFVEIIG